MLLRAQIASFLMSNELSLQAYNKLISEGCLATAIASASEFAEILDTTQIASLRVAFVQ
jgi:hypothetical protein